ncbi:MAG: PAS domain S-box protein, partial [Dehalococcoidales bacterium]|nr:PAS domain S-box protein [Dehalococcoidales bacterium]
MSTKKPTYEELKGKLEKTEALLTKLQKAKNNALNSVSENKEYLEAYKASEQNFKNLIDASPLGVRIITAEGSLIYANQAILDICGYKTPQELAAVPRDKLYTPESYEAHQQRKKKRTLKEFVPSEYEVSIKRPDGEVRHLQVFRREVMWGGERQFMALYQDITERKRAEEALRESEERFRGIFQQGPIGIMFSGLDYKVIFVNDQLCQMLGYTEKELRSMDLKDINYPGETDDDANLEKLAKGKIKYFNREKRGYRKNREIIWQNLIVTIVRDKNDKPLGYLTMIEDITERKRAEEGEKESEERFHSIVEHGNDGIVFVQQGLIQYCNTKMLEMVDYTEAEAIGKPFLDFVSPESKKKMADIYKKRVSGGKAQERYEAILVAKNGSNISVEISASLMNLRGETVDIAIVRDMTSRKNVEQTLEDEVTRKRILIEQSSDGIVVLDQDGKVYEANQRFCDMLGYTSEEVKGLYVFDWEFLYPKEQVVEMIRTVDAKGDHFETQHRRKDGTTIDVGISSNGAVFGGQKLVFCVCRDITERKRLISQQDLMIKILEILNKPEQRTDILQEILLVIKGFASVEAVGIRLKEGEDYPYISTNGFVDGHVETENRLCALDLNGQLLRDDKGNPILECMCGNIISGRFDPKKPFFTKRGSFWTNNTTELLASTTEKDRQARTRNKCNSEGYESVALIPIRSGDTIVGLIQLNDTRKNKFTLEIIQFFE